MGANARMSRKRAYRLMIDGRMTVTKPAAARADRRKAAGRRASGPPQKVLTSWPARQIRSSPTLPALGSFEIASGMVFSRRQQIEPLREGTNFVFTPLPLIAYLEQSIAR